jgi:hypothetical protein
MFARVSEEKDFGGSHGASVIVADRAYLSSAAKQKQASKPNTLD